MHGLQAVFLTGKQVGGQRKMLHKDSPGETLSLPPPFSQLLRRIYCGLLV